MENFGRVVFKIDDVLEAKNISKNKLEKEANLQRTNLIRTAIIRLSELI